MSAETTDEIDLQLGLIGDNIAASRAPVLHRLCGEQTGLRVAYDRLVPRERGEDFDEVFAFCAGGGFRGINVTYPYKERAARKVEIADPRVEAMGAVNTVVFEEGAARGYNTDFSGFVAAYRAATARDPGTVCMIGTGGVGRAIAFALLELGAEEIRLVDRDAAKAEALADDLRRASPTTRLTVLGAAEDGARGADGVVNCTPVGMVGYEGTPVAASALAGLRWAFDAVYTPADTTFLGDAQAAGAEVISGYELFFWQGVHAWSRFSGRPVDEDALRAALKRAE